MTKLSDENLLACIDEGAAVLNSFIGDSRPVAGIVLGSGLNPFAESLVNAKALSFANVPHMKVSTAVGHKGRFVLGEVPGTNRVVLCMQGRLHKYEGNSSLDVAFPIWLMAKCGLGVLITTNAAGAINPSFEVGDFCVMSDQINLTGGNPLVGRSPDQLAQRFVPMLDCFDPALLRIACEVGEREGIPVRTGVYLALLGPSFETAAEIRAFARLGADTVAMSVAEEVIAARHMGMRVLGMSLLTNMACGVGNGDPNSDDIMDVAVRREADFSRLVAGIVTEL